MHITLLHILVIAMYLLDSFNFVFFYSVLLIFQVISSFNAYLTCSTTRSQGIAPTNSLISRKCQSVVRIHMLVPSYGDTTPATLKIFHIYCKTM